MTSPRLFVPFALATLATLALAPQIGCGGDDEGGGGSAGTAAGGNGGAGGGGGEGAGGGPPMAGDHLLISEIVITPETGEFVEIWNPGDRAIDLTDYYLSDNSIYFRIANGEPWLPAGSEGSDFLVRFPAGATIAPDGVLVLAGSEGFEGEYQRCADYALTSTPVPCSETAGPVPAMLAPENGALGTSATGLLTNTGEMLMLFTWSGVVGEPVKDVDYLVYGTNLGVSTQVDKTGEAGYAPDTAPAMQKPAAGHAGGESLQRCAIETGETITGGNGATGHDETSEQLDQSFTVSATPDPGTKNACLAAM
jgi:hypothetical protein